MGEPNKNLTFKVMRDKKIDNLNMFSSATLPFLQNPENEPGKGSLAYNEIVKKIYYSDGTSWLPISAASGSVVTPYSLIISTNRNINTGVYTATFKQTFNITVDLCWATGNNLGKRTIRILYNATAIKELNTQPGPASAIENVQTINLTLNLNVNETIALQVFQDSGSIIQITGGNIPNCKTTINGNIQPIETLID